MPGTEGLLAIALVAIYLLDSMHFLCIGDAIVPTWAGRLQRVSFGSSFELGGRRPYLPNPLLPFFPPLRIEWDTAGQAVRPPSEAVSEMMRHLTAVRPLGWIAGACGALIVLVAPLALTLGQEQLFVASAILCFLFSAVAGALAITRRKALGLTLWQVSSMSLIALVCLPCSANFARALAAQHRWRLAASELPALGADAAQRASIRAALVRLLAEAQRLVPEDSAEHAVFREQLRKLQEPSV
jgi:hypothetical protein